MGELTEDDFYEDECDPWCVICNPELEGTNYFDDDLSDRDEDN